MSKIAQTGGRRPASADTPFDSGLGAIPTEFEVQAAVQWGRGMQTRAIAGLFARLGK